MRTVYDVVSSNGSLASGDHRSQFRADLAVRWLDHALPWNAPHAVVPKQVAGPEDTDELLRLRALVDDLRLVVGDGVDDAVTRVVRNVLARHGFGGES